MTFDVVVIGGGIVGVATALKLVEADAGLKVVILEKESSLGIHQTGHNSGVIHSGLYYQPGSLKASLCRQGYKELLEFCSEEGVPFDICGKVVIATNPIELQQLDELQNRGLKNGLSGLKRLTASEIVDREPYASGLAGLLVPETGIIDYLVLCKKYAEKFQRLGGEIKFNQKVIEIRQGDFRTEIISTDRIWTSRAVVTCAGLQSDRISKLTVPDLDVRIFPFRGEYFTLKKRSEYLVKHLIYPVPNPNFPFLGAHFTRMIGGGVECGPNAVLAMNRERYMKGAVNLGDAWEILSWPGFRTVARKYWRTGLGEIYRSKFVHAYVGSLKKLVPKIEVDDIEAAQIGLRAQACSRDGNLLDDFSIRTTGQILNVCNAPSPAATASLSIGHFIAEKTLICLK
jgi:L-2-hydroxyglutarate oxidase